jgi:hypothetical protein
MPYLHHQSSEKFSEKNSEVFQKKKKPLCSLVPMGHTCNPSQFWEAEIKKIIVQGQPGQKSLQDSISTEKTGHGGAHLSPQLQWEA